MKFHILLSVSVALCMVAVVTGYGSGAPAKSCVTLEPGHNNVYAQNSTSPYSISLDVTSYTPGTKVKVTISGTFQGVLLQARKADGSSTTPIGTFSDVPANTTKVTKCTADADSFTHSSKDDKAGAVVQWNPPSSDSGDIQFVATVAKSKREYWLDHKSASLAYKAGTGTTTKDPGTSGVASVVQTVFPVLGLAMVVAMLFH